MAITQMKYPLLAHRPVRTAANILSVGGLQYLNQRPRPGGAALFVKKRPDRKGSSNRDGLPGYAYAVLSVNFGK
jgi:hypothetical protein